MGDTSTLLPAHISVRFSFSILPPGWTRGVSAVFIVMHSEANATLLNLRWLS
jgi:hypothetical protein